MMRDVDMLLAVSLGLNAALLVAMALAAGVIGALMIRHRSDTEQVNDLRAEQELIGERIDHLTQRIELLTETITELLAERDDHAPDVE